MKNCVVLDAKRKYFAKSLTYIFICGIFFRKIFAVSSRAPTRLKTVPPRNYSAHLCEKQVFPLQKSNIFDYFQRKLVYSKYFS